MDLVKEGKRKIEWVKRYMKVINTIRDMYIDEKPFEGVKIAVSVHLEAKTAYLSIIFKELGADVAVTSSNPLTAKDDVVAALKEVYGLKVFAERTSDMEVYWKNIDKVLEIEPNIIIDDGADLGIRYIEKNLEKAKGSLWGICEETTTGVKRYKALFKEGRLFVPVIAINDSYMKYLFDNRYGTGQSTWDGIMRSTNMNIAGKKVVVAGYGWVGRGIAMRAKGLGARVIVTEVNPIRAVEALMDGFEVMKMKEAVKVADIVVTATGNTDIVTKDHFLNMKDGVILANAGHFDVEIKVKDLEEIAVSKSEVREGVTEYKLPNGKSVFLLGMGRLVNLVNADGHPIEIMDLSFSLQLEGALYILKNKSNLNVSVFPIPYEIDKRVAQIALKVNDVEIDEMTLQQKKYLESWK